MFRKANEKACKYTFPVIVSRQTVAGDCSSSVAAFVVVNDEGWIVTAFHVLYAFQQLRDEVKAVRTAQAQIDAITADKSLSNGQRKQRLAAIKKPKPTDTKRCSAWFGAGPCKLTVWGGIKAADIAIGKLEPWDPKRVSEYPVFKDPTKDFEPGTGLCKHGYPFHHFKPSWSDERNQFVLPPEALPVPRFPIEGIFTRHVDIVVKGGPPPSIPMKFLETSSPGLKGQSGGPIFDQHGSIWAIQSKVVSIPLGWDGEIQKTKQKVPQFLNVGLGVHAVTILELFRQREIKFEKSDY